jgi:hypothetical protein
MGLFDFFRRKKKNKHEENGGVESSAPMFCFVLAEAPPKIESKRANEITRRILGNEYSADTSDENIVSINKGTDTVGFLAMMPAPIPNEEAENNADDNFLWPNGREEVAKHTCHVIVTIAGTGEHSPIQAVVGIAKLTLVALELYDGLGVYWGNGNVCNNRETFENFCEDVSEEHVPLPAIMRFQFISADNDEVGLYTLGMNQFGLMEIEVDHSAMELSDLFEYVCNVAHYLVMSGPVIADGNTIGADENEKITVRHQPSMIDKSRKVYKILFE